MLSLKIKEVAQSKGFSMGELSRKSNVAYNTIKGIYREPLREVTSTTLNKIAKALGVPVTDLIEDVCDLNHIGLQAISPVSFHVHVVSSL